MFRLDKKGIEIDTYNDIKDIISYIDNNEIMYYDIDLTETLFNNYCLETSKIPISYYFEHSDVVENDFIKWIYNNIDNVLNITNQYLDNKYYVNKL